jgi:hypothetical protein
MTTVGPNHLTKRSVVIFEVGVAQQLNCSVQPRRSRWQLRFLDVCV